MLFDELVAKAHVRALRHHLRSGGKKKAGKGGKEEMFFFFKYAFVWFDERFEMVCFSEIAWIKSKKKEKRKAPKICSAFVSSLFRLWLKASGHILHPKSRRLLCPDESFKGLAGHTPQHWQNSPTENVFQFLVVASLSLKHVHSILHISKAPIPVKETLD